MKIQFRQGRLFLDVASAVERWSAPTFERHWPCSKWLNCPYVDPAYLIPP